MNGSRKSSAHAAHVSRGYLVPPEPGLTLRAEDAEDLAVISTYLQDALVSVRDLAYDDDNRTFIFVANRFRWETTPRSDRAAPRFERTLCVLLFRPANRVPSRPSRPNQ